MNAIPLSKLPKGEFIRLSSYDSGAVFIKGDYVRSAKAFSCHRFDDVNSERFVKASKLVFAGFTY